MALAKEKPGSLQFGSGGVGLPHHIAMEQFKIVAGINMVHVPYKGAGPMTQDIVGGNLVLGIGNVTATPLIRAGKVKALAVTAARRIPALAEVPRPRRPEIPRARGGGGRRLPDHPRPGIVGAGEARPAVPDPAAAGVRRRTLDFRAGGIH